VTILILAALWLAVLAPRWLRRLSQYQSERRFNPHATVSSVPSWNGKSDVVPLTNVVQLTPAPRSALVPPGLAVDREGLARLQRERARIRRRNILLALVVLAFLTLMVAITSGGVMIGVHLLVDVLLVGYMGALARRQRRVLERHAKVTDIASARTAAAASRQPAAGPSEEAAVAFIGSLQGRN
jgi:hypothetical protein